MSDGRYTSLVQASGKSHEERIQMLEISNGLLTDQLTELLVEVRDLRREGDAKLAKLETELAANSVTTSEVRDILQVAKTGLRAIGAFGTFVKWIGGIAAGLAALWGLYVTARGGLPK